ncbi:M23 family metallopeptidase [Anoxybacteroides tepidamans]|uniref:M23 family metallopeptidase n=1 Tax=Anoxybacteroides tepidamans TaxID=265948 RepID=UPI0004858C32|nr:M23 family metallopeptidase [Anoxybacillus tepidamans]
MNKRAKEIRKRIEKRKRQRSIQSTLSYQPLADLTDEERYGQPVITYDRYAADDKHPLFRKEVFLLKTLLSACLVLLSAVAFRNPSETLAPVRTFVKHTMEQEFQFAAVSKWYEKQFGEPLALFPEKKTETAKKNTKSYAVPASGKVLENFEKNGQGIMIETNGETPVEAMDEGIVIFAGTKEKLGKTVIIQHADGSESWYGNLGAITVKLYDFVEAGKEVGTTMKDANEAKGVFYFAIKQGDHFIDPIQVIPFE